MLGFAQTVKTTVTYGTTKMTNLQTYLDLRLKMREAQEQILAEAKLSWFTYKKLEKLALDEAEVTMSGKLRLENGYYAELESDPIRLFKPDVKIIGQKCRISIHAEQEIK
jgi:hypothetical protein